MEPQFHIGDDLSKLERALQELAPAPARLDVAQTMFRAGQAAASQSSSWRRVWPATSAVLALVSITLGTLLVIPDQPQIVYVPVDRATGDAQTPQPAMLATDGAADADNVLPAAPTMDEAEIAQPDVRSLSPFGYLRSRALALSDRWETAPIVSQHAPIPSLRSGDWRTLVGDNGSSQLQRESASFLPLDWTHLLNIRGS